MSDPLAFLSLEARDALEQLITEVVEARLAIEWPNRDSEFLTVAEAADMLRAKPQRVYDLLSDGRLKGTREGSRRLVSRAEITAYLDRSKDGKSGGHHLR